MNLGTTLRCGRMSVADYPLLTEHARFGYRSFVVNAILAQLVERVTCNLEVPGSIPGDGSSQELAASIPWGDSRVVKGGRL